MTFLECLSDCMLSQRANGVSYQQGRVVHIANEHAIDGGAGLITIEWDDGTRTTCPPDDILRSANRIHPLAARLARPPRQ
jgi:hypothetical protein